MRKILIIDDSPADTRELTEILVQHGYSVIQAEDGEAGLRAARDEQAFRPPGNSAAEWAPVISR